MNKLLIREFEKICLLKLSITFSVSIQCRKMFSIDNLDKNIQFKISTQSENIQTNCQLL